MRRRTLAAVLAPLALAGCGHTEAPLSRARADAEVSHELPARSRLAARARSIAGPRVMTESVHGRTLAMYGAATSRTRVLVVGCVNGTTCAGTDVVYTDLVGCPPPDAELWFVPTLEPGGADLDAAPDHPGVQAFRQAVADLRPTIAITFRTGSHARVYAATKQGGRFARLARLPLSATQSEGLAAWAATVLPKTATITVELPPGRVSKRRATRIAYAIDRLSGTRFAKGARDDRLRMIAFGQDPRESWH